jgi:tetratricopeptide (TPR) repeat protein
MTEPVGRPLGVLESSGLIRLATTQPDLEYLFRHVLVQDAAYESLLKQERRRLHVAVAEAIESLHPQTPGSDDSAGMLAWHYDSAGETDRALECYIRAGEQALRRYAIADAQSLFVRAQQLLDQVADADSPQAQRYRVQVALGLVGSGWISRPVPEMVAIIEPAVPIAESLGDLKLIGLTNVMSAQIHWMMGDLYEPGSVIKQRFDRALEIADQTGDADLRGFALAIIGRSSLMTRDPQRAAEVLTESLELTKGSNFIGSSMAANTLAMVYSFVGDFERADKAVEEAVALAEQSGDPVAMTDATIAASMVETERGDLDRALEMARASAARAAALNASACVAFSNLIVGTTEVKLGNYELARPPLELSNELAKQNSIGAWMNQARAGLSATACARGDVATAKDGWQQALDAARAGHDVGQEGDILVQRSITLLAAGQIPPEEALEGYDAALVLFERVGARPRIADALAKSADVLDQLGRGEEAADRRRRSDALREEMGLPVRAVVAVQ